MKNTIVHFTVAVAFILLIGLFQPPQAVGQGLKKIDMGADEEPAYYPLNDFPEEALTKK